MMYVTLLLLVCGVYLVAGRNIPHGSYNRQQHPTQSTGDHATGHSHEKNVPYTMDIVQDVSRLLNRMNKIVIQPKRAPKTYRNSAAVRRSSLRSAAIVTPSAASTIASTITLNIVEMSPHLRPLRKNNPNLNQRRNFFPTSATKHPLTRLMHPPQKKPESRAKISIQRDQRRKVLGQQDPMQIQTQQDKLQLQLMQLKRGQQIQRIMSNENVPLVNNQKQHAMNKLRQAPPHYRQHHRQGQPKHEAKQQLFEQSQQSPLEKRRQQLEQRKQEQRQQERVIKLRHQQQRQTEKQRLLLLLLLKQKQQQKEAQQQLLLQQQQHPQQPHQQHPQQPHQQQQQPHQQQQQPHQQQQQPHQQQQQREQLRQHQQLQTQSQHLSHSINPNIKSSSSKKQPSVVTPSTSVHLVASQAPLVRKSHHTRSNATIQPHISIHVALPNILRNNVQSLPTATTKPTITYSPPSAVLQPTPNSPWMIVPDSTTSLVVPYFHTVRVPRRTTTTPFAGEVEPIEVEYEGAATTMRAPSIRHYGFRPPTAPQHLPPTAVSQLFMPTPTNILPKIQDLIAISREAQRLKDQLSRLAKLSQANIGQRTIKMNPPTQVGFHRQTQKFMGSFPDVNASTLVKIPKEKVVQLPVPSTPQASVQILVSRQFRTTASIPTVIRRKLLRRKLNISSKTQQETQNNTPVTAVRLQTQLKRLRTLSRHGPPKLPTINKQTSTIHKQASTIHKQTSTIHKQIPTKYRQISTTNKQIPAIQRQISKTNKQVPVIQRQISKTNKQVPVIYRQISKTNKQVPVIYRQISKTNKQVPVIYRQISKTNKQIPAIQRQISKTNKQVPAIQRQISKTNKQIPTTSNMPPPTAPINVVDTQSVITVDASVIPTRVQKRQQFGQFSRQRQNRTRIAGSPSRITGDLVTISPEKLKNIPRLLKAMQSGRYTQPVTKSLPTTPNVISANRPTRATTPQPIVVTTIAPTVATSVPTKTVPPPAPTVNPLGGWVRISSRKRTRTYGPYEHRSRRPWYDEVPHGLRHNSRQQTLYPSFGYKRTHNDYRPRSETRRTTAQGRPYPDSAHMASDRRYVPTAQQGDPNRMRNKNQFPTKSRYNPQVGRNANPPSGWEGSSYPTSNTRHHTDRPPPQVPQQKAVPKTVNRDLQPQRLPQRERLPKIPKIQTRTMPRQFRGRNSHKPSRNNLSRSFRPRGYRNESPSYRRPVTRPMYSRSYNRIQPYRRNKPYGKRRGYSPNISPPQKPDKINKAQQSLDVSLSGLKPLVRPVTAAPVDPFRITTPNARVGSYKSTNTHVLELAVQKPRTTMTTSVVKPSNNTTFHRKRHHDGAKPFRPFRPSTTKSGNYQRRMLSLGLTPPTTQSHPAVESAKKVVPSRYQVDPQPRHRYSRPTYRDSVPMNKYSYHQHRSQARTNRDYVRGPQKMQPVSVPDKINKAVETPGSSLAALQPLVRPTTPRDTPLYDTPPYTGFLKPTQHYPGVSHSGQEFQNTSTRVLSLGLQQNAMNQQTTNINRHTAVSSRNYQHAPVNPYSGIQENSSHRGLPGMHRGTYSGQSQPWDTPPNWYPESHYSNYEQIAPPQATDPAHLFALDVDVAMYKQTTAPSFTTTVIQSTVRNDALSLSPKYVPAGHIYLPPPPADAPRPGELRSLNSVAAPAPIVRATETAADWPRLEAGKRVSSGQEQHTSFTDYGNNQHTYTGQVVTTHDQSPILGALPNHHVWATDTGVSPSSQGRNDWTINRETISEIPFLITDRTAKGSVVGTPNPFDSFTDTELTKMLDIVNNIGQDSQVLPVDMVNNPTFHNVP